MWNQCDVYFKNFLDSNISALTLKRNETIGKINGIRDEYESANRHLFEKFKTHLGHPYNKSDLHALLGKVESLRLEINIDSINDLLAEYEVLCVESARRA